MAMSDHDKRILRELAMRLAEIGNLPIMAQRRAMWKRHNRLERIRPMVLIFAEGSWDELLPKSALTCEDEEARKIEWPLRHRIYWFENMPDDYVFEPKWTVQKAITNSGYGVEFGQKASPMTRGAWAFDPVIHEPADMAKLRFPVITHDASETARRVECAHQLFDGILEVQLKGITHVSFHLMAVWCRLRGLEQVMLDMCMNPGFLHDAMAWLEEANRGIVQQYVDQDLLSLNNDDSYHSSGGVGYTDELPSPGFDAEHVRPRDIWASAEAQELAQVGPEMHEEFSLQYERRLLEPFALNGYGCCEDLSQKLDYVLTIPNIRRVSISPFADVDASAEKLGNKAIYSWKPHPAHLVGAFDATFVTKYIRHTLDVTKGCVVEMILKDTHTCDHDVSRFTRWGMIAKSLAEQY